MEAHFSVTFKKHSAKIVSGSDNMKFKIVADSSSDLKGNGEFFSVVPLKIITDENEFTDDDNINVKEMADFLSAYKGKSSTACPSVSDWLSAFGDAERIFAVTITSGLSGSFNSARLAKEEYEFKNPDKKVFVIDSLSAGPELKLICEKLSKLIEEFADYEEIKKRIIEYKEKTGLFFSLESLKNFANNGRVSKVTAKLVGALGIRLVGKASNVGTLEPLSKVRGEAKALAEILDLLIKNGFKGGKIRIDHCENKTAAEKLKEMIKDNFQNADVKIDITYGLCSFYAEKGGMLVGYERG